MSAATAKGQAVKILLDAKRQVMYSGEANSKMKMNSLDNAVDWVLTGAVHGDPGIAYMMRPKEVELPMFKGDQHASLSR